MILGKLNIGLERETKSDPTHIVPEHYSREMDKDLKKDWGGPLLTDKIT